MSQDRRLYHSHEPDPNRDGLMLEITPGEAGWRHIYFAVRRLDRGQAWQGETGDQEVCLVLLEGRISVSWDGSIPHMLGPRKSVFASYPSAVYLPPETRFEMVAEETSELAEGKVPARKRLKARIVEPRDCGFEIRGGGNATRQIVDILPPRFPADRLLACEVFTPGGNWSSYPPHKHDAENPPGEVRLEEVYYYRFAEPEAYGIQQLYDAAGNYACTLRVRDGDLVLVREGYHPFVAAYGHHAYYLNVLAGDIRSLAASDDPRYARFRRGWPSPDPRVPLIPPPDGLRRT